MYTTLNQALNQALQKRKNGLNEAIAVLRTGNQKFPNDPDAYITLSQALILDEKKLEEGTAMLHESIQKFPNSPLVYIAVSETLLSRENHLEESITILRKATQTAPGIYASLKGKLLTPENTVLRNLR